jgi:hypothetical protein
MSNCNLKQNLILWYADNNKIFYQIIVRIALHCERFWDFKNYYYVYS